MSSTNSLLNVAGLSKKFGGLLAVDDLSFSLHEGEILGIIGPNGAGKTTVFNLITGFIRPTSGRVIFKGLDITGAKPEIVARMGVARTFQNVRLFKSLTVLENVMVAAQLYQRPKLAQVLLSSPAFMYRERETRNLAMRWLSLLGLEDIAGVEAQSLAHGMQRRVELARALALSPQVLLLDEPAAGLNATESAQLLDTIRMIRDQYSISIVIVEHVMPLVMNLCERLIVLNYGRAICEGTCEQVRSCPEVLQAYLGVAETAAR